MHLHRLLLGQEIGIKRRFTTNIIKVGLLVNCSMFFAEL
jgi:hypothetical protein